MQFYEAILLGIIQGFTEWLPISSTAHLVLAHKLFNITSNPTFDIVIMVGTTLALIFYYRKELLFLFIGVLKGKKNTMKYLMYILVALFVTASVGLVLRILALRFFYFDKFMAILILVNGMVLMSAHYVTKRRLIETDKSKNKGDLLDLDYSIGQVRLYNAILIGVAQVFSLFPGISRSGITISAGIISGLDKYSAMRFSLLLGIPTMLGAGIGEPIISHFETGSLSFYLPLEIMIVGIVTSFVFGYISLLILESVIKNMQLNLFGLYSFVLGFALIILT